MLNWCVVLVLFGVFLLAVLNDSYVAMRYGQATFGKQPDEVVDCQPVYDPEWHDWKKVCTTEPLKQLDDSELDNGPPP